MRKEEKRIVFTIKWKILGKKCIKKPSRRTTYAEKGVNVWRCRKGIANYLT